MNEDKSAADSAPPLVSIVMTSYNNAQYLEQAINSCLGQKTTFPFLLIISDDCSTDGSQKIIRRFARAHDNIHAILQKHNAIHKNYNDILHAVRTKYAAFCDGDDFWLDENKLQMQVDFLENNPDFTVCAHKTDQLVHGRFDPSRFQPIFKRNAGTRTQETGVLYADEIADNYYLHTSSYVFRWLFPQGLPAWWDRAMANDHFLLLLHAAEGKIKYFDRSMSVWRRHDKGYTWLQTTKPAAYIREKWDQYIELQIKMDNFFEGRFHCQLQERVRFALHSIVSECLATNDLPMLEYIVNRYQKYFYRFRDTYEIILDGLRLVRPIVRPTAFFNQADGALPPPVATAAPKSPPPRAVGGDVPLDMDVLPRAQGSVWQAWTRGREYLCFHNAASALEALVAHFGALRVWLPTLCNAALVRMCSKRQYTTGLRYDITDACEHTTGFLGQARPGDVVITPRYFGRPLPEALCAALGGRPDVIWVDDRSYALDAPESTAHRAPWALYSPPSILGVPDGGILVGKGLAKWLPPQHNDREQEVLQRLAPAFLNYEFPDRAFLRGATPQDNDSLFDLSRESMSRVTRAMLERIALKTVSEVRKRNWRVLFSRLRAFALWDMPDPPFSPSAFPLMLPAGKAAGRLSSFLVEDGFLCPVPYGMGNQWRRSETLFMRLAALPLGHNYSESDMERLAEAVLRRLEH